MSVTTSAAAITVEISVDTRRLDAALRQVQRSLRQASRNAQARPVSESPEWRSIQRIGRREIDQATHWLRLHVMDVRASLGFPTCPADVTPSVIRPRTYSCSLEPDHTDRMHLSREGLSWPK